MWAAVGVAGVAGGGEVQTEPVPAAVRLSSGDQTFKRSLMTKHTSITMLSFK